MKCARAAVVVLACSILAACAAANAGYDVVKVSYDDTGQDQSARVWRAFMQALDQCHISGYENAAVAGPPLRQCERGSEANCAEYRVTLQYDCFGLGYQTSS